MKNLFNCVVQLLAGLALLFITSKSFSQTAGDEIIGTWLNQEKDGQIEIYKSNNTYAGKISWLKEQNDPATGKPLLDKKNPDEKLRSQPILGSVIMYGFVFQKDENTGVAVKYITAGRARYTNASS